jgi:hypothetical protein
MVHHTVVFVHWLNKKLASELFNDEGLELSEHLPDEADEELVLKWREHNRSKK